MSTNSPPKVLGKKFLAELPSFETDVLKGLSTVKKPRHAIEQHELTHLAEANAIRDVVIVAVPEEEGEGNRFGVVVKFGTQEKVLWLQTGRQRLFRSVDGATKFVARDLRFPRPTMDLSQMRLAA